MTEPVDLVMIIWFQGAAIMKSYGMASIRLTDMDLTSPFIPDLTSP